MNRILGQIVRLPLTALDAVTDSLRQARRDVECIVLRPFEGAEPVRLVEWVLVTLRPDAKDPVLAHGQRLVSGCLGCREFESEILLEAVSYRTDAEDRKNLRLHTRVLACWSRPEPDAEPLGDAVRMRQG